MQYAQVHQSFPEKVNKQVYKGRDHSRLMKKRLKQAGIVHDINCYTPIVHFLWNLKGYSKTVLWFTAVHYSSTFYKSTNGPYYS